MKIKTLFSLSTCSLLVFLFAFLSCKINENGHELFMIRENLRSGFIDQNGTIIINPVFRSASDFEDGLASARIDSLYGFIDPSGKFVIEPKYDFAEGFHEGLALVYKDSKAYFIDKKGEVKLDCSIYSEVNNFENGRAKVAGSRDNYGFIDKNGRLIIDTIFKIKYFEFDNGLGVVEGIHHNIFPSGNETYKSEIGVIDSTGKFRIPFGKYTVIRNASNGFFIGSIYGQDENFTLLEQAILDANGDIIYKISGSTMEIQDYIPGLIIVLIHRYDPPDANSSNYHSDQYYYAYLKTKGDFVFKDTMLQNLGNSSANRLLMSTKETYRLIDASGKFLSAQYFSSGDLDFNNGLSVVSIDEKYGIIDTNGKLWTSGFTSLYPTINDPEMFIFSKSPRNTMRYGLMNKAGKIIVPARFDFIDRNGFRAGLFIGSENEKMAYINAKGITVWKAKEIEQKTTIEKLNLDCMNAAYFAAASDPPPNETKGYARDENFPKKLSELKNINLIEPLTILVQSEIKDTFEDAWKGQRVIVANVSAGKLEFRAQDSRLHMFVQAQNKLGVWQNIEYMPGSFCGNSMHVLTLRSGEYWSFTMPVYDGVFKTKFRIVLEANDPEDKQDKSMKKQLYLYSNEFDGTVNPAQFWRKETYTSSNIMDPRIF